MKIGVDIDDTMVNFTEKLLDHYNKIFNENIKKSDIKSWYIIDNCKPEYRHLMLNITKTKNFYLDLELKPDVIDILLYLISLGHEIYIIGDPFHEFAIRDKYLWINQNLPFINHENIVFTASKQLVNVDILIDDNPDNFSTDVNSFTIPVLFDAPHNREVERFIGVKDWIDIKSLFDKFVTKEKIKNLSNIFAYKQEE